MAIIQRTELIAILVLVNLLSYSKCDVEIDPDTSARTLPTKPNYMPNIPGEHLLRGSSEDGQSIEKDAIVVADLQYQAQLESTNKSHTEDRLQSGSLDNKNTEDVNYWKNLDQQDHTIDEFNKPITYVHSDSQPENFNYDSFQDSIPQQTSTSTEPVTTQPTTEPNLHDLPSALGLSSNSAEEENKPVEEFNEHYIESEDTIESKPIDEPYKDNTKTIHNDEEERVAVELTAEIARVTPATYATEEATEQSATEGNVVKETNIEPEDVYKQDVSSNANSGEASEGRFNNVDYSDLQTQQPEAEMTSSTLEDLGGIGPRIWIGDDPREGQRKPGRKLEDQKPPTKKTFNPRPRPEVKLSKSSTLKSWLEDPWLRAPAGLLVPLRAGSLGRALAVWNELSTSAEGLNITDILLIGFDANGISWMSRHNLQNSSPGTKTVTAALTQLMLKYQGLMPLEWSDADMQACALAAKRVPYDSALFLLTDTRPSDSQRLPVALRALVEKRLKVYTIWTDPSFPSLDSEMAVADLKRISEHTGGDMLPFSPSTKVVEEMANLVSDHRSWMGMPFDTTESPPASFRAGRVSNELQDRVETLLVRRGGGGPALLGVPVESGVRALRVNIDGAVDRATLYPPKGAQIDLFNDTTVLAFSRESRTISASPLDVVLMFPGSGRYGEDGLAVIPTDIQDSLEQDPNVGVWHLSVRCESCDYRVTVTAHARIGLDATLVGEGTDREMLQMRVRGPAATVRESTLIDEHGVELAKLPFSHQPSAGEDRGGDPYIGDGSELPGLIADVPLPPVRGNNIYVKVVGRDIQGQSFVRLAGPIYQRPEPRMGRSASIAFPEGLNDLELMQRNGRLSLESGNETVSVAASTAAAQVSNQRGSLLTAVQIGLSTKLYGSPGDTLQLYFEVTNYRDRSVNFRFEATGQLRFLRGIRPTSQSIQSGQTAVVVVEVGITTNAQVGARDQILFTATGLEQVSISAYVYVVNPEALVTDVWSPNVRHTFQGSCMGRQGSDCAQHAWSTTVFARDQLGGLLRLSSSPVGIRYETNFISGTRDEVIATYRSTCCATRLLVNAVDVNGNANSYTIDISYYFTDAAIAAIVLGVLLLITLIILIVIISYLCYRKRKESRELPSYATPRREA